MKKRRVRKGIVVSILAASMILGGAQETFTVRAAAHKETAKDYIVNVADRHKLDKLAEEYDTVDHNESTAELLESSGCVSLELNDSQARQLEQESGVVSVERDEIVSGCESDEADQIIQFAKEAWNIDAVNVEHGVSDKPKTAENGKKKIAVIDSGVDITEDIDVADRVDLLYAGEESSFLCCDMTGHGTAVASIICAKDDDNGVTGIDDDLEVYSVRILDENNEAPISRVVAALQWCEENGIDIINMSFGTNYDSDILREEIKSVADKGILMIAAAGNDKEADQILYPAAYEEVMAVGGVSADMSPADCSVQGAGVELSAPGEYIPVLAQLGGLTVESGTSMAVPHIAAVAAKLWENHADWSADKIRQCMDVSAKQLADGNGKIVDYKAASELAKDFDAVYQPNCSTSDLPECGSHVTAEDRYEIPGVVAKWMEKGHNSLIRDAVSDANLKSKYTDKKIAVLKAVSLAVDTCSGTSGGTTVNLAKDVPNLHAHKFTNYITTVYYLYKIAYLQKKNPSKSITEIMNSDSAKGAVIDLANLSYLNKAINIICTKELKKGGKAYNIPNAYTGTNAAANNRALRVLGMALHVAGDAFSHKSIVPNDDSMRKQLWKDVIGNGGADLFMTSECDQIIRDMYGSYITYSALDQKITHEYNGKSVNDRRRESHRHYADYPGSNGNRYQYGAKHAVSGLLQNYYNKHNKFNINAFNNFGANDSKNPKNDICLYRVYTYARKLDKSISTTSAWKTYSRCD